MGNDVIIRAESSIYRHALRDDIQSVRNMQVELAALKGYVQPEPTLEAAFSQICIMLCPPREVHVTVQAMFMVLGEAENLIKVSVCVCACVLACLYKDQLS